MYGICLYIQIRFESLDVKHFKDLAIKVALAFLNDFETAFIKKIAATVGFSEMFANCWIFVFSNALEKVLFCVYSKIFS